MKFIYTLLMLVSFSALAQQGSVVAGGRGPQIDWSNLPQKVLEMDKDISALQSQNASLQAQLNGVNNSIYNLQAENAQLYGKLTALESRIADLDSRLVALEPKYVWQCSVTIVKQTSWSQTTTTYPGAQDANLEVAKVSAKKACVDKRDSYGNRVESVTSCNSAVPSCNQLRI